MRISYGSTRTVVLVGNWAIKLPTTVEWRLFLLGLLANMRERQFYTVLSWRHKLCPILWSIPGGWAVIMRRARILTDEEFIAMDLRDWATDEDGVIPCEQKSDSFGYIGKRLVIVDYGN